MEGELEEIKTSRGYMATRIRNTDPCKVRIMYRYVYSYKGAKLRLEGLIHKEGF